MSDATDDSSSAAKNSNSSIAAVVSKIGQTITHTKDALMKDLLADMPAYLPDITKADSYTYEQFTKKADEDKSKPIQQYVDGLFTRVGYNLSGYENRTKLTNVTRSIIATTYAVGDCLVDFENFLNSLNNADSKKEFIWSEQIKGIMNSSETQTDAQKLFELNALSDILDGTGGDTVAGLIDKLNLGDNFFAKLLKLVLNLIYLIKSCCEINLDDMKQKDENFRAFVENSTYSNTLLAERILNHFMIVIMRYANDIFGTSTNQVIEKLEKDEGEGKNEIKEKLKKDALAKAKNKDSNTNEEEFNKEFDNTIKQIIDLNKEIKELQDKINEEKEDEDEDKKEGEENNDKKEKKEESVLLKLKLKNSKINLEKLIREVMGEYNRTGKTITIIYAVLDFLKVFDTETVQVAKYNKGNDEKASLIQINTIRWKNIEKLFTTPFDYIQSIYLIRDTDEAETLLAKIMSLVNACNSNTPDFGSLRNLLYDFMIRIWDRLNGLKKEEEEEKDDAKKLSIKEDKLLLLKFQNFIIDLIKVQEKFAIGVKKELTEDFNKFLEDKENKEGTLIDKLYNYKTDEKDDEGNDVYKGLSVDVKDIKFPKLEENGGKYIDIWFVAPFERIFNKKVDEHNEFSALASNWTNVKATFKEKYKTELDDIINGIKDSYKEDDDNLKNKFKEIIEKLKKDFEDNRKSKIPENFDLIKKLWLCEKQSSDEYSSYFDYPDLTGKSDEEKKTAIDAIFDKLKQYIENEEVKKVCAEAPYLVVKKENKDNENNNNSNNTEYVNPLSSFDYIEYFTFFANQIKTIAPGDLEQYYEKFKTHTIDSFNVNDNKSKVFIEEIFTFYWAELKTSLYKTVLRPFNEKVGKTVKDWSKDTFMPKVLEFIKGEKVKDGAISLDQYAISNELNFGKYKDVFDDTDINLAEKIKSKDGKLEDFELKDDYSWTNTPSTLAEQLLKNAKINAINDNEKEYISTWEDGLQFALKLYKVFPKNVKKRLSGLVDLPGLEYKGMKLPDYTFDIKNKFISVSLYEYPDKDKKDKKDKKEEKGENSNSDSENELSIKLIVIVKDFVKKEGESSTKIPGVFLLPVIKGSSTLRTFSLPKDHELKVGISGTVNQKDPTSSNSDISEDAVKALAGGDLFGFFFTTYDDKDHTEAEFFHSKDAFSAYLQLLFQHKDDSIAKQIFGVNFAELTIKNYPQKIYFGYEGNQGGEKKAGFNIGYTCGLKELDFKLKLHEINGFFKTILSNDIIITIDKLDIDYNLFDKFRIEGGFKVRIPLNVNIDLSLIKFSNIILELGTSDTKENTIAAKLLTTFKVDFKGIVFAFNEMGFGIDVNYMTPEGKTGDLDFAFNFQFPTGLAIAINLEAVKGIGLIQYNKPKEEFVGALQIKILEMVEARALLIFAMKMPDGSKGFSFMGAISVFFTPGIQLSMGFSITGIGGSLGINRRIDMDKLTEAVRDGTLETMLFVKDLDKNLDTVLANITSFYPIQKDQFFFGFLARITWVELLQIEFGLFIQAPDPVVIFIAGGLHLNIADSLLKINVAFAGGIDFSKGLFFDASLYDSQIVGLTLSGDMALRIYWAGDTRGFILSAGGFHPQYTPEAGFNVSNMKRLSIKLDYSILKISLETYFAVTSNTVQFGARLELKIGWDSVGIFGELYFNVLFQFKPFFFMADIGAKVAAKLGDFTLLAIGLEFALSGPGQWNARGNAEFTIIGIEVKCNFNKSWTTGGNNPEIVQRQLVTLLPQFIDNYIDKDNLNWKITSGDMADRLVDVVPFGEGELVMQPSDRISFSQDLLPLNREIVRYGEAIPSDLKEIKLNSLTINDGTPITESESEWKQTTSYFAPTLINKLDDNSKLKAPSFEKMNAGFLLTASCLEENGGGEEYGTEYNQVCEEDWESWMAYIDWSNSQKQPVPRILAPGQTIPAILTMPKPIGTSTQTVLPMQLIQQQQEGTNMFYLSSGLLMRYRETAALRQLDLRLAQMPSVKPSLRRTETGFKRNIVAVESKINRNVNNLVELLDKK